MVKMGERPVRVSITQVAALTIQAESRFICPLDIGTTLAIFSSDLQTCRNAGRHEEAPLKSGAGCMKGTYRSDLRTAGSRLSRTVLPLWRDKMWEDRGEIPRADPIALYHKKTFTNSSIFEN